MSSICGCNSNFALTSDIIRERENKTQAPTWKECSFRFLWFELGTYFILFLGWVYLNGNLYKFAHAKKRKEISFRIKRVKIGYTTV